MNDASSATDSDPSRPAGKPFYKRAVLKISGEAFCKPGGFGIDGHELQLLGKEIAAAAQVGTELAVVVGGGNMIRGAALAQAGHIDQATADYMGMLGTAINGLALKEMLERLGQPARVLSAINLSAVAETFIRGRAIRHLERGRLVIFGAGTGNPYFSTDTTAALRANEVQAEIILKATKVDGIYDKDPMKHDDAIKFDELTYMECLARRLSVMDSTAFSLCMDNKVPILVIDLNDPSAIKKAVTGEKIGTLVH